MLPYANYIVNLLGGTLNMDVTGMQNTGVQNYQDKTSAQKTKDI